MMDNIRLSIIHSPYFPFKYSATSSISGKRVALLIESVSSSFNIVSLSLITRTSCFPSVSLQRRLSRLSLSPPSPVRPHIMNEPSYFIMRWLFRIGVTNTCPVMSNFLILGSNAGFLDLTSLASFPASS